MFKKFILKYRTKAEITINIVLFVLFDRGEIVIMTIYFLGKKLD